MADPLRVQICGPLKRYAHGFGAELARQGYTRISARYQLQLMAHLSRWLADKGLDSTGLTPATIEAFVTVRRAAGYTNYRSPKAVGPLLEYLRGLGVLPLPPLAVPATPVDAVLERYRHYLTVERGLVTSTARGYAELFATPRQDAGTNWTSLRWWRTAIFCRWGFEPARGGTLTGHWEGEWC